MDCKATLNIGDYSRGGKTRGASQASDHDMGCQEKYSPCGIVDEDSGALHISFGSSYKTSDFIVDTVQQWWATLHTLEQQKTQTIQIKGDNGPQSTIHYAKVGRVLTGLRFWARVALLRVNDAVPQSLAIGFSRQVHHPRFEPEIPPVGQSSAPLDAGLAVFWSDFSVQTCA